MKRVAIYIRVSTQAQAQEGDSIPAQREALMGYIKSHQDLVLVGEYMDDGVSGQKYEQRDELQRMISDVQAGKIDLIICTKMDRLHRSLKHFIAMQEILDKHNVQWLSIWEPMYDTTTPTGQLIITQMMAFAQFEAQNTGSRIKAVVEYKLSQGQVVSGAVPCGYSIVDKRLVPNELAESVKEAYSYYARTGNLNETILHCCHLPGLPRYKSSFRRMLTNATYIGEHRGNSNFCPPIIDKELFYDVQRKLSMNIRSSQKHSYIFNGLIKCTECGSNYSPIRINRRCKEGVKAQIYYRCPHHYAFPKDCPNQAVRREELIEDYLLGHIKEELQGYIFTCQQNAVPIKDNAKKIGELKHKIDRLKELFVNDMITLEEYRLDKARYTEEIESLAKEVPEEPIDTSRLEELLSKDMTQYYQTLSREEKRFFWRSFVSEIRMNPQKELTVIFL